MSDVPDYTLQPKPIQRDTPGMHDLVIADTTQAWADTPSLMGTGEERAIIGVIEELEQRKEFGLKKYGTLLQANNGRDAIRDALDEALDLIVYMKQMIQEIPESRWKTVRLDSMYRNAIEFAIGLKFLMNERENTSDNSSDDSGAEAGSPDLAR